MENFGRLDYFYATLSCEGIGNSTSIENKDKFVANG